MKHCATILRGTLLLAVVTFSSLDAADTPETKQATPKIVTEPNANAAWQRRIPEFGWDNWPLSKIVAELRARFPEINFLIKQTGTDIDVESISTKMILRAVTLPEILKALELATQHPIQITGGPVDRLVVFESKAAAVAVDAAGLPPASPVPETRVFNLSNYLDNRSDQEAAVALKELDDVIDTAAFMWTEASGGKRKFRVQLKVHRSTKLLIAVGRPDELALIEQVVTGLQGQTRTIKLPANAEDTGKTKSPGEKPAGSKL